MAIKIELQNRQSLAMPNDVLDHNRLEKYKNKLFG